MKTKFFHFMFLLVMCLPIMAKNNAVVHDSVNNCTASFTYSTDSLSNMSYQFYGSATGTAPFQYQWNFGDGSSSSLQNPLHSFSYPGIFNVCLTIHSADSCYHTYCHSISVDTIINPNCTAFYAYHTDSLPGRSYQFYGSATGTAPFRYQWNFGDGSNSFLQNPAHSFNYPGIYNVCLTIYSADSCSNTYCTSISVDTVASGNCAAFYTYSADSLPGNTFQFYGSAIGTPPFQYEWNYGDGNGSTQQNPIHTFGHPGIYNICLTIYSADSCSNTYCHSVALDTVIHGNCTASYTYNADSLTNLSYQFYGSAAGTAPFQYQWNFGDGSSSFVQNPVHAFTYPGNYQVCLTIFSADSCSDTYCNFISADTVISGNCHAMYYAIARPDSLNSNHLYYFYDASTGNFQHWLWNFGDSTFSTVQNPVHVFSQNGIYQVCLTVYSADSVNVCSDTFCQSLFVGDSLNSYNLSGQVRANNYPIDEGIVNVYSLDSNYVLVNSTVIDSSGYYYFILPAGQYIVRAELSPNSVYFGHFAPTYYIHALNWQQASTINLYQNKYDGDIDLIGMDSINTGIGAINGRLIVSNKKVVTASAEIVLLNTSNQPVSYTKTNNSSYFSLNSLELNAYKVYAEIPGYHSIPVPVILTQSNPVVTGLNLEISTSITDFTKTLTISRVYPNPVVDVLTIETNMIDAVEVNCCIYNTMGMKVDSKILQMKKGINTLSFDTQSWANGLYLLTITSSDKTISETKKIVK